MRWVIVSTIVSVLVALQVAACGGKPSPRARSSEIPVTGTATLAGTWLTNDDMDWGYRLVLVPDGRFAMYIDRGKMGACQQKGRLTQGAGPSTFTLTVNTDGCNPTGATGGQLTISVPSYTGESLTLMYMVGANQVRRVYQRDPKVPRPN